MRFPECCYSRQKPSNSTTTGILGEDDFAAAGNSLTFTVRKVALADRASAA
jgi:hypothetical protein